MRARRQPYYQVVGRNGFTPYRSGFGQVPVVQNRVLGISPMLVQHRRDVMIPSPLSPRFGKIPPVKLRTVEELKTAQGGALLKLYGAEPLAVLAAIVASPTSQEVEEARAIDLFFGPVDMRQSVLGQSAPPSYFSFVTSPTSPVIRQTPIVQLDGQSYYGAEAFSNPFLSLHPDVRKLLVRNAYGNVAFSGFLPFAAPEGWNVDYTRPWGEMRSYVLNILTLGTVMNAYPWPQPGVNYMPRFWLHEVRNMTGQLDPFIRAGGNILSDDDVRTFITLTLVGNYDNIMTRIENEMQRAAERDARRELIKKIGLAVTTLIIGGAIVAAVSPVAGAVFSSVLKGADALQKVQAAQGMATVAEQFAATDAAFSAEVSRVAKLIDAEAATAKEAAPPTPEETTALVEGVGVYEVQIEGRVIGTVEGDSEAATRMALEKSTPGDRVEIFFTAKPGAQKVSLGLFIRTGEGMVKVPPEADAEVRAAQRQQLAETVKSAEAKATATATSGGGGGFPWWILIPAAALIVGG